MQPVLAAAGCFVLYIVVYRFYARYLGKSIFQLDPTKPTPAHEINDGVDYVPCRKPILFGAPLCFDRRAGSDAGACHCRDLGMASGHAVGCLWNSIYRGGS